MHEIRVHAPQGLGNEIAALALRAGISEAAVVSLYLHGPNRPADQVSVSVSTPQAKAFLNAVFAHERFDPETWSITSRELRAIFSRTPAREITRPMTEPSIDVFEDLWQLSHISPSYIGRAFSAALILAYGMIENNAVSILIAALFLPFLSVVLALSFGLWSTDRSLSRQGFLALLVSIVCCVASGALVAFLHGPPVLFHDFQPLPVGFAISAIIGVAAGLSVADDAGRRHLIGVAAAVQYAIFPVWFGICLVFGFPGPSLTGRRLLGFSINFLTLAGTAVLTYGVIGMRRRDVHRFVRSRFWSSKSQSG